LDTLFQSRWELRTLTPHPRQELAIESCKELLQAMGCTEAQILATPREMAPEFFKV
jgi:hypothetical protein